MSTPNTEALRQRLKDLGLNRESAAALLEQRNTDLALKPDDAQLRAEVEALEREIEGHDREAARIEAAISSLAKRNTQAERQQHLASLRQHRAEVDKAGRRMTALTERLIAQIEGMGPILSELATLADARSEHARVVLRERMTMRDIERGMAYQAEAARRTGAPAAVVAAALWRAGIGRLGLQLDPWVTVTPPRDGKADRYLKGDLRQVLQEAIERADERLAFGMDEALRTAQAA